MKQVWAWFALVAAVGGCAAQGWCAETLVFDSHSPRAWGGYSSPNGGVTTRLSATQGLTISRVGVLNEMLSSGELRFAILSRSEERRVGKGGSSRGGGWAWSGGGMST